MNCVVVVASTLHKENVKPILTLKKLWSECSPPLWLNNQSNILRTILDISNHTAYRSTEKKTNCCGVQHVQCRGEKKIPLAELRLLWQTTRKLSEYLHCFTTEEQTVPSTEGKIQAQPLPVKDYYGISSSSVQAALNIWQVHLDGM